MGIIGGIVDTSGGVDIWGEPMTCRAGSQLKTGVENSLCGRDSKIGHTGPSEAHLPENGAHWSASETRLVCGFKNASN